MQICKLIHRINWLLTSFKDGISKTDKGADDDAILALSPSSLAWRDLEKAFGTAEYSRELLR
jgi:hypothetical protein